MTVLCIRVVYLLHYSLERLSGHFWYRVIECFGRFIVSLITKRIDITGLDRHDDHIGRPWWCSSGDNSSRKPSAQTTADRERDVGEAS